MSNLVHNEMIKVTAGWLDRVSTAVMTAGVIAPLAAVTFGFPGLSSVDSVTFALFILAWTFAGVVLHLGARLVLKGLRP